MTSLRTAPKLVDQALTGLNRRERRIIEARKLTEEPLTLEHLSGEFGVSRERVRQIEVRALEKIQHAVRRAAATPRPKADWAHAAAA